MRKFLFLLMFPVAAPCSAVMPETDLFLAGGALQLCSDLQPKACSAPVQPPENARKPAAFVFDSAGIERALDPLLWRDAAAPDRMPLRALLQEASRRSKQAALSADEADELLDKLCGGAKPDEHIPCKNDEQPRAWRRLLDAERAAVMAALEVPQIRSGQRAVERALPMSSRTEGGLDVVRAFVEAARAKAGGGKPRIAIVTASSFDPFDPVDFYVSLFDALGAETSWWPIDAALNAALTGQADCAQLDALRRTQLQLPARERVYPDLAAAQRTACENPQQLAAVPEQVHGIFFGGGDQWRLRQALVDAEDRPNAWLQALRRAHAAGRLVVGGTSAGAAVQSGGAMLSNGSTEEALRSGPIALAPPQAGCARAQRCAPKLPEESFTWWRAGGTGLAAGATVDTHFSERGRELRLLLLMHASGTPFGYGADETSALRVRQQADHREIEAHGEHGGWVFERTQRDASGAISARVHYLAPGVSLRLDAERLSGPQTLSTKLDDAAIESPSDALADGALRDAAQILAAGRIPSLRLKAGNGSVTLLRTPQTRAWKSPRGNAGVLNLVLRYEQ
jgi:cyanophycinase-like exopeptidase